MYVSFVAKVGGTLDIPVAIETKLRLSSFLGVKHRWI